MGGEPLLNFNLIKHVVKYTEKFKNKNFSFSITTNGTILDENKIEFFKKNRISILLSIDGPPEVHDKLRVFPKGKGSYQTIQKKMNKLLEENNRRSLRCSARGTFTRINYNLIESVLHLIDLGFTNISVEPCVTNDSVIQIKMNDFLDMKEDYIKLADIYINFILNERPFSYYPFDKMIERILFPRPRTIPCSAANGYIAVSVEGDLYPCQKFVGNKDFVLGDIFSGINNKESIKSLFSANTQNKTKCQNCWAAIICGGGCYAHAVLMNNDIMEPYDVDCEYIKHMIKVSAYIISSLENKKAVNHLESYLRSNHNDKFSQFEPTISGSGQKR